MAAGVLSVVVVAALAGCATNSMKAVKDYRGEPKGVEAPASSAGGSAYAVWLKDGDQFTVTLYGSSTCPPVATRFKLVGKNTMKITLKETPDRPCTADYVPHTTVFSTPNTVDRHSNVAISVDDTKILLEALPKK